MTKSSRLQAQISPILYNRLLIVSKRDGVTIAQLLTELIRNHLKVDDREMAAYMQEQERIAKETEAAEFQEQVRRARERSQAKQTTTDEDLDALLVDVREPEQAWLPDEAEMQRKRQQLLAELE